MILFPTYSLPYIFINKYIRMYDKTVNVVPVLPLQVIGLGHGVHATALHDDFTTYDSS